MMKRFTVKYVHTHLFDTQQVLPILTHALTSSSATSQHPYPILSFYWLTPPPPPFSQFCLDPHPPAIDYS